MACASTSATTTWSMSSLKSALPSSSSSSVKNTSQTPSIRFSIAPSLPSSSSRLSFSHFKPNPKTISSFVGLAPLNPLLSLNSSASPQHLASAGWRTTTSVRTAVAAVDASDPVEKQQTSNKYYFVVANAKFMLDDEEHFQEQLCERLRLFGERNMEQDFWLVIEPKFLDKFPDITKRLKRPAVALVSTNGTWIRFMKLRLDRVLSESFEADTLEEALAYNPVKLEFEKPANWVAPYPKYESEWWGPFLPPSTQKQEV